LPVAIIVVIVVINVVVVFDQMLREQIAEIAG
jgi:hypothetical protein